MGKTWKLTDSYYWEDLKEKFSFVADLENTPQEKKWHGEGDVGTHTKAVLTALKGMLVMDDPLFLQQEENLLAATFLHDIEKPSCTIVEDGVIVSPRHAVKGAQTVREMLYKDYDCPFHIREEISKLVRFHGLPVWLLTGNNPEKKLLRSALQVNTKLVYLLAKADLLGRISDDFESKLVDIELFKEYCIEKNCWGIRPTFKSPENRFDYFIRSKPLDYDPYNKPEYDIYIMSGLPGTGKDYYIENNMLDLPVISLDAYRRKYKVKHGDKRGNGRIAQLARNEALKYMRVKQSFIWNATNITHTLRQSLINFLEPYNPRITIVYLEVPYKTLIKQNMNREYPIPEDALHRMIQKLDVPYEHESHIVEHHVTI